MNLNVSVDFLKDCITGHNGAAALVFQCPGDIGLKELDDDECNCDCRTCTKCWRQALEEGDK